MIISDKHPGSTQYIVVHNIYFDFNYSLLKQEQDVITKLIN